MLQVMKSWAGDWEWNLGDDPLSCD